MGEFPDWFPDGCPNDAVEANATLYRGCETNPPTNEDFTPHARSEVPRKRHMARGAACMGYGLSVWISQADARHAQELFPWAARWHIFSGDVTPDDGQLAATGTRQQPAHHSFWAYDGVELSVKFESALPPLVAGA